MKDGGRKTEDEGRRTKDEGRRTKDGGRKTEDGGQDPGAAWLLAALLPLQITGHSPRSVRRPRPLAYTFTQIRSSFAFHPFIATNVYLT
jgi:hypothetical protein